MDDCQDPPACFFNPGTKPLAAIGHVGPDGLPPSEGSVCGSEQPGGYVRVPQVCGVHEDTPQESRRLDEEMALAAVALLRASIAVGPPVSVVFTVGASIMAADGWGWRPMRGRTVSRS